MDVLIVEPVEPELLQWCEARHATRYAPQLEADPLALRQALFNARALLASSAVAVDAQTLQAAPLLRVVGSLGLGIEHIDSEACARHGVEVVRPGSASAAAEAEFAIGAMLQLLRRVPVRAGDGALVGRELGGASVGLLGMSAAARPLAALLRAFGAQVSGYDPALHRSDGLWQRWAIEPVSLRDLFEKNDVVCVLLSYFSRYKGLLGERHLASCKPGQVLVNLARSSLFDEQALAEVLGSGRMAAAWFDSIEPGLLEPGRPLHTMLNFQATPRVAGVTRESRSRNAWAVVQRVDQILNEAPRERAFRSTMPDDLPDPEDASGSV